MMKKLQEHQASEQEAMQQQMDQQANQQQAEQELTKYTSRCCLFRCCCPFLKRYLLRCCCLFPMLSHPPFLACSSAAARFLLCYCLFLLCCSCLILLLWPVPLLLPSPASSCALGFYWWAKFVVIFLIFPLCDDTIFACRMFGG